MFTDFFTPIFHNVLKEVFSKLFQFKVKRRKPPVNAFNTINYFNYELTGKKPLEKKKLDKCLPRVNMTK